jgi:beta-ureidopropionase
MEKIRISAAQFEHKCGDKEYNLSIIETLSKEAASSGSEVIAFHECSVTGYTFAGKLSRAQLLEVAELIPEGESVLKLIETAGKYNIIILAGLFEKDRHDNLFKAHVCVGKNGLIAVHRKLHPFIHPDITPGDRFTVFDINGWNCGILICYDNNIVENVRATALLGAEIIFMPHVTMCTPSPRPGAGFVDPELWENRKNNPEPLRKEFDGPKGREWLMKWLPSRAYDNGVYVVFSNPVGMDDDQLKNGSSMIIDPFGEIIAECRELDNDLVTTDLVRDKLTLSGGYRYTMARRPDLYKEIIGKAHNPVQKVAWKK